MSTADLLVEEAYYWNYAQHLDFGYLDHPPMVALLVRCSTFIFGDHEFNVRLPALICWVLTSLFTYKLTEDVCRTCLKKDLDITEEHAVSGVVDAPLNAVMLLAVLPFFFLQTLVMTPDLPLLVCWSASLHCLYRALVLNETRYWYFAGLSLGLGMLSKYTIVLLGLATLIYMVAVPIARTWFKRKEPYLCAVIVLLLFTPVIYWNATHAWVSFIFQSQRRFASVSSIDLPYLFALVFLFITPWGVRAMWRLTNRKPGSAMAIHEAVYAKYFLTVFIFVPFGFFALYSLNHEVNLNWPGPLFLALIPWIAVGMSMHLKEWNSWIKIAGVLLLTYSAIFLVASLNTSAWIQREFFVKSIAWSSLIKKFNYVAAQVEASTHKTPIFIALDNYPLASELTFYQSKLLAQKKITTFYPVLGAHVFGQQSLMYRYWSKDEDLAGKPLILVSKEKWRLETAELKKAIKDNGTILSVWSHGQGQGVKNIPYYYKIVTIK